MSEMHIDVILEPDWGFKVMKLEVEYDYFSLGIGPDPISNMFRQVRAYCKESCDGIWGYTPVPRMSSRHCDKSKYGVITVATYYFCFHDEADVLGLTLRYNEMTPRAMYPSSSKFTLWARST